MTDKILCPWCGAEMEVKTVEHHGMDSILYPEEGRKPLWNAWTSCTNDDCGAEGPIVVELESEQEAIDVAIAAALRRYRPPKSIEEDDANKAHMPEWISVKDKLPENDSHYLVFASDTCEVVECIYYGDGEWMTKDLENMTDCVTHWMPLPKHPKEGALNGA